MANAAPNPAKPLLVDKPWNYLGMPKSTFFRLKSQGLTPGPVTLPGSRPRYRTADLDRWIASLAARQAPKRKRRGGPRKAEAAEGSPAA